MKVYALQSTNGRGGWVTHDYETDISACKEWVKGWSEEYNEAARFIGSEKA